MLPKAAVSLTTTLLSSTSNSFPYSSSGDAAAESTDTTFNKLISTMTTTEPSSDSSSVALSSVSKNVNIYWIGATGLAIWFLFIHAPPYLRARKVLTDAPFLFHLIGAYSIYLTCSFNTLVTPSIRRSFHIWAGRVGMIMGIFGFLAGLYLCYWPWRLNKPSLDFSIGITIGGVAQVLLQARGYLKIKKFQELRDKLSSSSSATTSSSAATTTNTSSSSDTPLIDSPEEPLSPEERTQLEQEKFQALAAHIGSMISLFVIACGVPAAIRLVDLFGFGGGTATLIASIFAMSVVAAMYEKSILKRIV